MELYRNVKNGKVIKWDESKGNLTKVWQKIVKEEPVVEEVDLAEDKPEPEVEKDPEVDFYENYAEINAKADKEKPAFVVTKGGVRVYSYKAKDKDGKKRWTRDESLEVSTTPLEEKKEAYDISKEDWSD